MTIDTSTDIERYIREEPVREATYTTGPFGQRVADLPPMPTMPARYHFLSEIERKVEGIRSELTQASEQGLWDELWRFMEYLWEQMATEQGDDAA